MLSGIIDTCAEEEFISDEVVRIKKQFRPLSSVKLKWYIHRILPKDTVLVFLCHHGVSSRGVAEHFAAHGFTQVHNVTGGIDAWSQEIDDSVPRY